MEDKLKTQILIAASQAKAEGFDGTYGALLEMLSALSSEHSEKGKAISANTKQH